MTDQENYYRLSILAGLNVKSYEAFGLTSHYGKYRLSIHLNNGDDFIHLKSESESLSEVIEQVYFKYLKITGKLPEFDPNKAIEYVEAED